MDLSTLSLAELRQLREQLDKELPRREKQEREKAIEQIYKIAHSLDMPLSTLLSQKVSKKQSAPSAQYQDPNNPDNRWTGRGPRPAWLKQALAAGGKLDDFRATAGSLPSTAGEPVSHMA